MSKCRPTLDSEKITEIRVRSKAQVAKKEKSDKTENSETVSSATQRTE